MKIVIAPQAFKGCASAHVIASAMAAGVHRVLPMANLVLAPVADGGDGTLDVLLSAKGGERFMEKTVDANNKPKSVYWGAINAFPKTAVIESSRVCGLASLKKKERNPLKTTTYGIGSLIDVVLTKDYPRLFIGLGGSATNDAGMGLAQAIGVRFLNAKGKELSQGGGSLIRLKHLDISRLNPLLNDIEIIAGCDVINPLIGPQGSSLVYGPQKGATKKAAALLEDALGHFAHVVKQELGIDISNLPYLGSAGGSAAALFLFCNAKITSGADWILKTINFDKIIEKADLVITGEGCLDFQTASQKAPLAVAMAAKKQNIRVIAIAGMFDEGAQDLQTKWFDTCVAVSQKTTKIPPNALQLIEKITAETLLRL